MQIRRAEVRDLPNLVELGDAVHALHASARPDEFRAVDEVDTQTLLSSALDDPLQTVLVCGRENAVVGYLLLREIRREANPLQRARRFFYIDQVCVAADGRRQGAGRRLIEAAWRLADEEGVERVVLDVWHFNRAARDFFAAQGFEPQIIRMERIRDR